MYLLTFRSMSGEILQVRGSLKHEKGACQIPRTKHCLTAPHHGYGAVLEQKQWLAKCQETVDLYYNNVIRW